MPRILLLVCALCVFSACGVESSSFDRSSLEERDRQIRIVGSSTVSPFATTVAEHFGVVRKFMTPIVETTGTGGGMQIFCQGIGLDTVSIVNASRPMKDSEKEACARNGVTDILEVKFGFDGIVLVNAKDGPELALTKGQLYRALAAEVMIDGVFAENDVDRWSDISPELPNIDIQVFGPPPTSGTRDAFLTLAMEKGAVQFKDMELFREGNPAFFREKAHTIRTDGKWIDAGENDTAIIQTLTRNMHAYGIVGFSFLDQNRDRIKAARVGGIDPTFENISSGEYAVSRSLYFYVKLQNIEFIPGIAEYVEEFTSEDAWGPIGYLQERGLIPLPPEEREEIAAQVRARLAELVSHS